jgi:hypothetical protein
MSQNQKGKAGGAGKGKKGGKKEADGKADDILQAVVGVSS